MLLVLPVASIIKCCTSTALSAGQRAGWLLAMVFVWPLTGMIYALRHPSSPKHRFWGIFSLIYVVAFSGLFIVATRQVRNKALLSLAEIQANPPKAVPPLTAEDHSKWIASTTTLHAELRDISIFEIKRGEK